MAFWIDKSFDYRGFKCIWDHAREYFMIREYGASAPIGFATTEEKCRKMIDKEIGK